MLRKLYRRWCVVAKKIGYFQSQVILTLVYFTVLAPFAVLTRLLTDPLQLRGAPSWHRLPPGAESATLNSVRQQF